VKELPDLLRAANEHRGRVRLLLVSCDTEQDSAKAAALLGRFGVDFESYRKTGSDAEFINAIAPEWGGALPLSLVFDRAGKKIRQHEGQASYEEFSRLMAPNGAPHH
jgi:cytochrome oxidase Cu insertion factor (SCO1/SenC/PrrC family)